MLRFKNLHISWYKKTHKNVFADKMAMHKDGQKFARLTIGLTLYKLGYSSSEIFRILNGRLNPQKEMPGNGFFYNPTPSHSRAIDSHSFPFPSPNITSMQHKLFWAREDSSLNMPLKLTISCVHFYSTETRKIVAENIISFGL